MFSSLLEERLSLVAATIVASLAVAVLMGNGFIAAGIAILLVLTVLGVRVRSRKVPSDGDAASSVLSKQFSFRSTWTASEEPKLDRAVRALSRLGLTSTSESDTQVVLNGGSGLRTRLLGGYFVAPKHLPVRVEITKVGNPETLQKVELRVSDSLKVALRDKGLERRYELAATSIREIVESSLKLNSNSHF
jgi:hypothetical protein